MPLSLILRYIVGDADAIRTLAKDKTSLKVGFFFVLLAGIAREHDQESILHKPFLFLAPLFASLLLAFFHYSYLITRYHKKGTVISLRSYLGLFWMTAPLALCYSLPVEYLFDSLTAVKINTALLATVSLWRVLLFSRVLSVALDRPFRHFFIQIMWGGCVLITVIGALFTISLTDVMGGMVHSEEAELKRNIAALTSTVAFWFGWIAFVLQFVKVKRGAELPVPQDSSPVRLLPLLMFTFLGFAMMALRQPALLRSATLDEQMSHKETIAEGLAFMAAHAPEDFARTWPLPPADRSGTISLYRLNHMLEHVQPEHPDWIRTRIIAHFDTYLEGNPHPYHLNPVYTSIAHLPETPEVDAILVKHQATLNRWFLQYTSYEDLWSFVHQDETQKDADSSSEELFWGIDDTSDLKPAAARLFRLGILEPPE